MDSKFQFINSLDEIYNRVIVQNDEGKFVCPVCQREYKSRLNADTHIGKRSCHSQLDLFKDTALEESAYDFYKMAIGYFNSKARVSLKSFRCSKTYGTTIDFVMFCMQHHIDREMYLMWVKKNYKCKYFNQTLAKGNNESITLRAYYSHLRKHEYLIDSEDFADANHDSLLDDDNFLVNAIYKGKIGISYAVNHYKLDERVDDMDEGIKMKLNHCLDD